RFQHAEMVVFDREQAAVHDVVVRIVVHQDARPHDLGAVLVEGADHIAQGHDGSSSASPGPAARRYTAILAPQTGCREGRAGRVIEYNIFHNGKGGSG